MHKNPSRFSHDFFLTLTHSWYWTFAAGPPLIAKSFVLPYSHPSGHRPNRATQNFSMTSNPKTYYADYAVVGSGVAGLRAAIELSSFGTVLVLAKSTLSDSATAWAQGGVAVALSDEDEIGC